MTKEALTLLWQHRHQWTDRFLATPEDFKVCDQCLSICSKSASACHMCACYRFYKDTGLVRVVARKMATVPWPRMGGVIPRLATLSVAPQKGALAQSFKTECRPQTLKPSMTPKTPVLTKVPYEFPKERARIRAQPGWQSHQGLLHGAHVLGCGSYWRRMLQSSDGHFPWRL